MKILITGGSGFVGRHLIDLLNANGHSCVVTSRSASRARTQLGSKIIDAIQWNLLEESLDLSAHPDIDGVINLMGDPVAGRWNENKKTSILESRVEGTRRLVDAMLEQTVMPSLLISSSAVGYYGDMGETFIDEQTTCGTGFLPDVCRQWETAASRARDNGIRTALIRIGIVLGKDGGALEKMLPMFKWCLGGRLGSGMQFMPWIHIVDLCRLLLMLLENETCSGPYNGVSPFPIRNAEFTRSLSSTIGKPALLAAPALALRLVLGGFAESLLWSQRVIPAAAIEQGFRYDFPELDAALTDILS